MQLLSHADPRTGGTIEKLGPCISPAQATIKPESDPCTLDSGQRVEVLLYLTQVAMDPIRWCKMRDHCGHCAEHRAMTQWSPHELQAEFQRLTQVSAQA
jgi:hypothetical protein